MFEPVFENLRKATETTIQMQQEVFKKWIGLWPCVPTTQATGIEQLQKFQKKWTEFIEETVKRQRESLEAQFAAGRKTIDGAIKLIEVKEPEELRAKTVELWQQCVDSLRQTFEAQAREFQAAVTKWTELMTRGAA